MKISFRDQSNNRDYAFMMEFELENISAYKTDTSNLRISATFRRTGSGDNQLQNRYPVILELHGRLARANGQGDIGATLCPVRELPISFSKPTYQQWLNLQFIFPIPYLQILEIEVICFEKIETDTSNQSYITIPRSTWVDRILPGLGYGRSVLIELPLVRTPAIPEAYRNAAKALENARNAFNGEDYRGAVKYGREVTEYLENSCYR